ncbi:uncharacterized protein PHACADRAFT_263189 [Phanerochaete carnosa HHB-10118-sp]|uniref:Uncharacterized protein n=1 Tax=Phanerochaete carnosa (strain HHB-10118-sp) TaxID=650164 RepID=K5UN70_PHACS|nr:uncharacterized protein PHACADRAFT_263189 [Phanerochaete carnosa HHB-10118-sp]EKM51181.1 hypothetical protein PHACADRAFT_263189 [Phanerochaete carnosa HHB-10118-sp]
MPSESLPIPPSEQTAHGAMEMPGSVDQRLTRLHLQNVATAPRTPPAQISKRLKRKRSCEESLDSGDHAVHEPDHKRQRNSDISDHSTDSPSPTTSRVERVQKKSFGDRRSILEHKGKQPVYPPGSTLFWAQQHAALAAQSQEGTVSTASSASRGSPMHPLVLPLRTAQLSPGSCHSVQPQSVQARQVPVQPAVISIAFSAVAQPSSQLQVNSLPVPPATICDPSRDPRRRPPRGPPKPVLDSHSNARRAEDAREDNLRFREDSDVNASPP